MLEDGLVFGRHLGVCCRRGPPIPLLLLSTGSKITGPPRLSLSLSETMAPVAPIHTIRILGFAVEEDL